MAAWLAEHPRVYFSPVKEPHYFNTDLRYRKVATHAEYAALFRAATDRHTAIGEGSVWYLYSETAVPRILDRYPDARFVVAVRNPVEMAYSLHDQLLYAGWEHVESFEEAWRLNSERREGRAVPKACTEPRLLDYRNACALGTQLQRVYRQVPASRVHVVVMDDLVADSRAVYRAVLDFLGIEDDGRSEFLNHNPSKERRSMILRVGLVAATRIRDSLGLPGGFGIANRLDALNSRERRRGKMSEDLRRVLVDDFAGEVALLSQLLERDLSSWSR